MLDFYLVLREDFVAKEYQLLVNNDSEGMEYLLFSNKDLHLVKDKKEYFLKLFNCNYITDFKS